MEFVFQSFLQNLKIKKKFMYLNFKIRYKRAGKMA